MLKSLIWGSNAPESEGNVYSKERVVNCNFSFFKFPVCGLPVFKLLQHSALSTRDLRDGLVIHGGTNDVRLHGSATLT